MTKEYIVDASVVLTWLIGKDSKKEGLAFEFLRDNTGRLYSQSFIDMDVSNGLVISEYSNERIEKLYQLYRTVSIIILPTSDPHLTLARNIAREVNDTVYDSYYHALARLTGKTMITFDKRYYKKAKHLGNIELLK
jgi:predicted nucleic acid-binding protein